MREIDNSSERARIIFVDLHGEATSEKVAMGWHLDGKVITVAGTGTHYDKVLPMIASR